jgi:hypothetical protein
LLSFNITKSSICQKFERVTDLKALRGREQRSRVFPSLVYTTAREFGLSKNVCFILGCKTRFFRGMPPITMHCIILFALDITDKAAG